jgi:hypothetical protein
VSAGRCTRTWEAAAVEDGRLAGADRSSFERHVETCEACAYEVKALSSLRQTMQAVQPAPMTELDLRRLRHELLRRAHVQRVGREAPGGRPIRIVIAAIAALAVVATSLSHVRSPNPRPALVQSDADDTGPSFDFVDLAKAVVTSTTVARRTEVVLSDGIAAFHVEHVRTGHRFLLALPDGEIEVRGTRFVVNVQRERTQSVDVSEGVVELRLKGQTERLLGAGERWVLPESSTGKAAAEAPPRNGVPSAAAATSRITRSVPAIPPIEVRADAGAGDSRAVEASGAAKSERFAAAVDSFREARYAAADALLLAFMTDYPLDPRCEDAAFLRAVAHARMGDAAGAASLARAYLADFPKGLRRLEASDLVGAARNP